MWYDDEMATSNLLRDTNPDVYSQWDDIKNIRIDRDKLTRGSEKKIWWLCGKNHSWEAPVMRRTRGQGCPYCSGRRAVPGETDLPTLYPDVAKQWAETNPTPVNQVRPQSNKKAKWVCDRGHEWEARVQDRTVGGQGCPYCSGRRVLVGQNDLASTHPDLAAQWSTKNTKEPFEVSSGSHYRALWVCPKGHEWEAKVYARKTGAGCIVCAGRVIIPGYNDVASAHPHLVSIWDPTNDKSPYEVGAGSEYKPLLVCSKGHEWTPTVYNAIKTNGCPVCSLSRTSRSEQELYSRIKEKYPSALSGRRINVTHAFGTFLYSDVYLEEDSAKYVMEYDGAFFHKEMIDRDTEKTKALLNKDYRVIRIREQTVGIKLPFLDLQHPNLLQLPYTYNKNYVGLDEVITEILLFVGTNSQCYL